MLLCARESSVLDEAGAKLSAGAGAGQIIATQTADVSQPPDVKLLVDRALSLFPQIHILVNNAGVYGPKGLIEDVDWSDWVKAIEINLFGSVLLCRAVLPHLRPIVTAVVQLSGAAPLIRYHALAPMPPRPP